MGYGVDNYTVAVGPYRIGRNNEAEFLYGVADPVTNPVERVTIYSINELDEAVNVEEIRFELNELGGVQPTVSPFTMEEGTHRFQQSITYLGVETSRTVTFQDVPIGTTIRAGYLMSDRGEPTSSPVLSFGDAIDGAFLTPLIYDGGQKARPGKVMRGTWVSLDGQAAPETLIHSEYVSVQALARLHVVNVDYIFMRIL